MANELNLSLITADLKEIRLGLLRLHKALLENQKASYEAQNGRVNSTNEYLNLVLNDAAFAWLRVMSGLIVEIDEALDAKTEPLTEEMIIELARAANNLITSRIDTDFGAKYEAALQKSPDATFEHIKIIKGLGKFKNEV